MPAPPREPFRPDDAEFALLRYLTPPVVAVTTSYEGRRNGFIVNSAQRASLVPEYARISFYCSKPNFSHDLILRSGMFAVHLLRRDQWPLIARLGLRSGRDEDKLAGLSIIAGTSGCPVLSDCTAAFECAVVNIMDAGAATFVLGDVVNVHVFGEQREIMTSEYFRAHMPKDLRMQYEANLLRARQYLAGLAGKVDVHRHWGSG